MDPESDPESSGDDLLKDIDSEDVETSSDEELEDDKKGI